MPTLVELQCNAILTAAASADIGICVTTDNVNRARQCLYRFRKELGDPTFENLQIRVSPNNTEREIWIIRKDATVGFIIGD